MEKEVIELFKKSKSAPVRQDCWWGKWWLIPEYNKKNKLINVEITPIEFNHWMAVAYVPYFAVLAIIRWAKQMKVNKNRIENNKTARDTKNNKRKVIRKRTKRRKSNKIK